MKKYIALLLVFSILLSLTGCSISIDEDDVEEIAGEIGEAIEQEVKKSASNLWGEIIGCEHVPHKYDKNKITVKCKCRANEFTDLCYEDFAEIVPRKLFKNQEKYATEEYFKYIGKYNGVESDVMTFILNSNVKKIDGDEKAKLSSIVADIESLCGNIASAAELDDRYLNRFPNLNSDFFEKTQEYFESLSTTLSILKVSVDIVNYANLAGNDGDKTDKVLSFIELLKDATGNIPLYGKILEIQLDVVAAGAEVLIEGREIEIVSETVFWAELIQSNLIDVKNYDKIQEKRDWDEGPTLAQLAAANLSPEEITGLTAYIEYRIEKEIKEGVGVELDELIGD